MSPRSARARANGRRILSLVFVAVIYADVATLFAQSDAPLKLPIDRVSNYYNRMFNVFANWSTDAIGYVVHIQVRPRDEPNANWEWQELDVHELFPMPRGESFVRIYTLTQRNLDELARQLLLVYRRRHPDLTVAKLRLYHATWPTSTAGYRVRYGERKLALLARV